MNQGSILKVYLDEILPPPSNVIQQGRFNAEATKCHGVCKTGSCMTAA